MDWFLYDRDLRHEKVTHLSLQPFRTNIAIYFSVSWYSIAIAV